MGKDGRERPGLSIEMNSIFVLLNSNFPSESGDDLTWGGMLMLDCKSEEDNDPGNCSSSELYLDTSAKEEFVL